VLICGASAACVLKHDDPINTFTGTWNTKLWRITDSKVMPLGKGSITLERGAGQGHWVCADGQQPASHCNSYKKMLGANGCASDGSDCVMEITVTDSMGRFVDQHIMQLTPPGKMKIPLDVKVTAKVAGHCNDDQTIDVTVINDGGKQGYGTALYVSLITLEGGIFESNGFFLPGGTSKVIRFLPLAVGKLPEPSQLAASLRVDHVAIYLR